jgi:hypothetical protein
MWARKAGEIERRILFYDERMRARWVCWRQTAYDYSKPVMPNPNL